MKKSINPLVAALIVVVFLGLLGYLVFRQSGGGSASEGDMDPTARAKFLSSHGLGPAPSAARNGTGAHP